MLTGRERDLTQIQLAMFEIKQSISKIDRILDAPVEDEELDIERLKLVAGDISASAKHIELEAWKEEHYINAKRPSRVI